jgi:DNA invertase Pin-like site-specific DNA recombinase
VVRAENTRRQTTTANGPRGLFSTLVLQGYCRASTADQNPDAQRDALLRAGVHPDQLDLDHTSGAKSSRPAWDRLCKALRAGDVLVATRLDRVGRSTTHLVSLLDQLTGRGVAFRFLEQGIDTTTSEGRLMYRMLAAIAEFQRDLIIANTREGLAAARARGRTGGRKPKLTTQQVQLAQQLYDARDKWRPGEQAQHLTSVRRLRARHIDALWGSDRCPKHCTELYNISILRGYA